MIEINLLKPKGWGKGKTAQAGALIWLYIEILAGRWIQEFVKDLLNKEGIKMESKEIMGHLDFMIRTCREAARSVHQQLLPAIEEAYRELVKMVAQRYEEEKARAAQFGRLAKLGRKGPG